MQQQRIGILGGTFDPVHLGHLKIAQQVQKKFKLKQVLFIPCYKPPHKKEEKLLDSKYRYQMLRKALKPFSDLKPSKLELIRKGISYSYKTLLDLKKKYPLGTSFYFILGTDAFLKLHTWKRTDLLFQLCEFVVVNRTERPLKANSHLKQALWHSININPIQISATEIRSRVAQGKSISRMVPKEVAAYIVKNNLYCKLK